MEFRCGSKAAVCHPARALSRVRSASLSGRSSARWRGLFGRVGPGEFHPRASHRSEDVFEKLFSYLHAEHTVLRVELDTDPTYATAARCFLKLIEHRKAENQRREE